VHSPIGAFYRVSLLWPPGSLERLRLQGAQEALFGLRNGRQDRRQVGRLSATLVQQEKIEGLKRAWQIGIEPAPGIAVSAGRLQGKVEFVEAIQLPGAHGQALGAARGLGGVSLLGGRARSVLCVPGSVFS